MRGTAPLRFMTNGGVYRRQCTVACSFDDSTAFIWYIYLVYSHTRVYTFRPKEKSTTLSSLAYRGAGGTSPVKEGGQEVNDRLYPHAGPVRPKTNEAEVSAPTCRGRLSISIYLVGTGGKKLGQRFHRFSVAPGVLSLNPCPPCAHAGTVDMCTRRN